MTDPTEHERASSTSDPEEETTLQLKGFKTKRTTQILNAVSLCMTSLFLCQFWMPKICFCLAQENLFLSYT